MCGGVLPQALFATHLESEEQHIFPALRAHLNEAELVAIQNEIRVGGGGEDGGWGAAMGGGVMAEAVLVPALRAVTASAGA